MVDAIGVNRVAATDVVRASTATTAQSAMSVVGGADAVQTAPDTAASDAIALSRKLAVSPPVDAARVAEIRKAIADGTFPILPATIADRMLALKLDWTSHDKA